MEASAEKIEAIIYEIRGLKVMLDRDLARLYGVEVRVLNQAVKRNLDRFPEDFSFLPNFSELEVLRSQFVILDNLSVENHFKFTPRLFTENGVAMLSSVLKSKQAVRVSFSIFLYIDNY